MKSARTKIASIIQFPIFGIGFENLITRIPDVEYMGEIGGENATEFLKKNKVDIVFLSLRDELHPSDKLFRDLKSFAPGLRIAIFLNSVVRDNVKALLDAGVNALLQKTIDQMELDYAIKVIMNSGLFVSQEISSQMVNTMIDEQQNNMSEKIRKYNLTPRELQVMSMVFQEYSNQEIAVRLKISTRTVEAHRTNILNKTGIKNSVGLAKFVIDNKLDKQPDFMKYLK